VSKPGTDVIILKNRKKSQKMAFLNQTKGNFAEKSYHINGFCEKTAIFFR
jgi:hypothetical protein